MFARAGLSLLAVAGAFALTVGTASTAQAQAQNPMVGNWTFNAAKSTSSGTDAEEARCDDHAEGRRHHRHRSTRSPPMAPRPSGTFTTKGDGKPVPVTGWAAVDTVTSTLTGRTGKTIYTKAGKPVMESNTEVSADGKVLMIKGTRPGPDGKPAAYSSHYDRK